MSLILQIESSSEICSVALSQNGKLLSTIQSDEFNIHTEKLTIFIKDCLAQAAVDFTQLDAVAVSDGPGSYTSLRVGISAAKGICYAMSIPLIAIDSLLTLAHGIDSHCIHTGDLIIPMIDARRMEIYTSIFDSNLLQLQNTDALIIDDDPFSSLATIPSKIHICGNGAIKYYEKHHAESIKLHHTKTSATYMCAPAFVSFSKRQFVDVAYYTPNYFKAPNITKSKNKLL